MVRIGARHLVLSPGALGSSYLLLRNRDRLPAMSPMLGRRFSGNGDLLTLVLDAHTRVEAGDRGPRLMEPARGPVITSTLRSPDEADGEKVGTRGFYLQDAGFPVFLDWLAQSANLGGEARHLAAFVLRRAAAHLFRRGGAEIDPDLERLLQDTGLSAGTMPLLGMGRDVPDGVFRLDDDQRLALDWNKRASQPFYNEVVAVSRKISTELEGRFLEDPLTQFLGRLITVHPLGGCNMGTDINHGVVDSWVASTAYQGCTWRTDPCSLDLWERTRA